MPSKSKAQRQAMAIAEHHPRKLYARNRGLTQMSNQQLHEFAKTKEEAIRKLSDLQRYAREHQEYDKLKKIVGVLKRNFDLLLTLFDNPEMSPYNNTLEGFNYLVKRKTRLMKGFKKEANIHRWLKLILLDWRFHLLASSEFPDRRGKSPLELAGCNLPKIRNWMTFIRKKYPKKST